MKLFIGIPSYTNPQMRFATSLINVVKQRKIELALNIGLCYLGKARNELAMDFLASDCDTFLQIDDDLIFTAENVDRIASHDLPVVGGAYFKKQMTRAVVAERLEGSPREPDENGLLRTKYVGGGFMCVKREVYETMIQFFGKEDWFWYRDEETDELRYDFYSHGIHPILHRWLGEDWYFCQRAMDAGFTCYLDTKCVLGHIGQIVFPLPEKAEERVYNPLPK